MNRLFNEYDAYNEDGNKLAESINKGTRAILQLYMDLGFDGRDIQNIAVNEVSLMVSEMVLRRATQKRRNKTA